MQTPRSVAHRILTLLAALLLSAATGTHAEPADWEIDPEHFSIAFGAGHVGYQQQLGMFLDASGSFRYDPETQELSGGRVEVQAESVFTNHDERDGHRRETLGISAHTTIQRSRWGMDYAMDLVGDEVTLRFELEALRQ